MVEEQNMQNGGPSRAGPVTFVFTTLAIYQTRFWIEVTKRLIEHRHLAAVISFDDRSTKLLSKERVRVFSAIDSLRPAKSHRGLDQEQLANFFAQMGVEHANILFGHERTTFEIGSGEALAGRLAGHLEAVGLVLDDLLAAGERPVLIQETGGFLSVIGAYYAARARGIDNWFIEPAFYRGRVFFIRNSFAARAVAGPGPAQVSPEVTRYLGETLASKQIVIPRKDAHQYRSAAAKVFNARNLVRLVEKLVDKHLLGTRQEFGHIGQYVRRHLGMLTTSWRLARRYRDLSSLTRFVYYPLHVPSDLALTIRSPEYLDQIALVDFLARAVPFGYAVAIKEHPAQVGALPFCRMEELLRRNDNLALLPPGTNNFDVLRAADLVVSVNSKSGAEALLLGTPVVTLGDAFYRPSGLVEVVERLSDLPGLLAKRLATPKRYDDEAVKRYFQGVWDESSQGELYSLDRKNVEDFVLSLLRETRGEGKRVASARAASD